jgi:hypothetical protein
MEIASQENPRNEISADAADDLAAPANPEHERNAGLADKDLTGDAKMRQQGGTESSKTEEGQGSQGDRQ